MEDFLINRNEYLESYKIQVVRRVMSGEVIWINKNKLKKSKFDIKYPKKFNNIIEK